MSKVQIDTSTDLQANANRVTVYGVASGTGLGYDNFVQINCNTKNNPPFFESSSVKARTTVFSISSLSYTGYCTFPTQTDASYLVSAHLMPENILCTPLSEATVVVKGTGKASVLNPTPTASTSPTDCGNAGQKRCDTSMCKIGSGPDYCKYFGCNPPVVSDGNLVGNCIACPAGTYYDDGRCYSGVNSASPSPPVASPSGGCGNEGQQPCDSNRPICKSTNAPAYCKYYGCNPPFVGDGNPNGTCIRCPAGTYYYSGRCYSGVNPATPSPVPSSSNEHRPYSLQFKWTLFGVPFGKVIEEEHSCVSNAYYFDSQRNGYVKVSDLTDPVLVGKGMWLERSSMSGDCTLQLSGTYLESQTIHLTQGWNLVSIQTANPLEMKNNQNCNILKGPMTYSGFMTNGKPYGYYAWDRLDNGVGYWIKVAQDCTLNTNADEVPPAPPT